MISMQAAQAEAMTRFYASRDDPFSTVLSLRQLVAEDPERALVVLDEFRADYTLARLTRSA